MWFFETLKGVIPDDHELMFISDRNTSLLKAVRTLFPLSQHGYCIWHLSQNVKGSVAGKAKQTIAGEFMKCAKAYTKPEFLSLYATFRRRYPPAAAYLDKSVKPEKWARCYFPGDRYNIVTSNSVESVNGCFKEARRYTLLPMIDMIFKKMVEWFNKYRKEASEVPLSQKLVPYVDKILEKNIPKGNKLVTEVLNHMSFEYSVIGRDGKNYVVSLEERSCTCNQFNIDRYPCVHAIAAVILLSKSMEVQHYQFASHFYLVEQWAFAYRRTIYPVPHMSTWLIPNFHLPWIRFGYPPEKEIKKGPPQQNRYPSVGEHQGRGRGRRGRGRGFMYEYLGGERDNEEYDEEDGEEYDEEEEYGEEHEQEYGEGDDQEEENGEDYEEDY